MDDVMATINNMLVLNSDIARDLADVRYYQQTQASGGNTSTAYKIYSSELTRNFSQMGELLTLLGSQLQTV